MSEISAIDIPNHKIIKQLGTGGMATVYLAIHQRLQREVALKIMKPEIAANGAFQKSFITEGQIVAKLEHPNILTIYDIDTQNGYSYMSTEVLREGNLKKRLADGPLPLADVLTITLQIADALNYAHQQGYIHRDIKPANIMFRKNDAVLTDFGLAKMQGQIGEMTQIGCIAGTPFYMSPEQGAGSAKMDQRTDIYSLGIVFYEMLTGDKPYSGLDTVSVLYDHVHTPIPTLEGENRIFQAFLNKALAKNAEERFNTIEDFVTALREASEAKSSPKTISNPHSNLINKKSISYIKIIFGITFVLSIASWFYFNKPNPFFSNKQAIDSTVNTTVDKTVTSHSNSASPLSPPKKQEQKIYQWISSDNPQQWDNAIKGLKKLAKTNNIGALIWLGYIYELGRGVATDWGKAWNYYSDAIQQNDTKNKKFIKQRQLALERQANKILQNKNSPQAERNKAYQLIQAVAEHKKSASNAHLWMAYRYQQGDGITKNKIQAERWQKKYNNGSKSKQ